MNWNRDGKKKEIWEQDKNKLQIAIIHAKVWFRKFQRETKGLGILFLIMMAVFMVMQIMSPFLASAFKTEEEKRVERQAYCFKYGCIEGV